LTGSHALNAHFGLPGIRSIISQLRRGLQAPAMTFSSRSAMSSPFTGGDLVRGRPSPLQAGRRHSAVAYDNKNALFWTRRSVQRSHARGTEKPRTRREKMKSGLKFTAAIACGLLIGGGTVQLLHAQSKPPAYVVAEVAVKDKEGFEQNFLKSTSKDILDHGGKYLAGGYDKTISLVGDEPPNRVVIVQFANMDAVKAWRDQGAMDMENTIGSKYAKFRIYAVEGVTQ
jgi:uncharacterized protein (DUF1330 family)